MSNNIAAVRVADPRARRKIVPSKFNKMVKVQSVFFSFLFLICGNSVKAQSANGFMDTLKGLVNDPLVNSMLMSKASNFLGGAGRYSMLPNSYYSQQAASAPAAEGYGAADQYDNAYGFNPSPNAPSSGFYSMDNGARLGGIGYDPSFSASAQVAPPLASFSAPSASRNILSRLPAMLAPSLNRFSIPAPSANQYPSPSPFQSSSSSGGINSFGPSENGITISKRLAPSELRQLSRYDLTVLIDRSGSMNTRDCPDPFTGDYGGISRWQWCREQTAMLARQTAAALPDGITVVPFSSKAVRYENVSAQSINNIFNTSSPEGSTNLAGALKNEFDRYFQDRDAGLRKRPMMIAVITDGVPDSKGAVRKVIEEATQRLVKAGEIRICFFLIGDDRGGADFVDELVDSFDANPSNIHMIVRHPFAEVNQVGLPRSLAFAAKG